MTLSFEEVRFPEDISYGSRGGPKYSTDIIENFAGYEQRNINWSSSRAKYNVSYGIKSAEQIKDIIKFFHTRRGKAIGFRFKDWTDYQAFNVPIAAGDGVSVDFQLVNKYKNGLTTLVRDIKKPVDNDTIKIYINDTLQDNSTYSVDFTTGIVTFNEAPADGVIISADFEFDVPVRFDTDNLDISPNDLNSNTWSGIKLVELRV